MFWEHCKEVQAAEAHVLQDGRVDINLHKIHQGAQEFLRRTAISAAILEKQNALREWQHKSWRHIEQPKATRIPRMNIAIIITGSRGDVQPFIALGQTLQKPPYEHRVRICTHPVFKEFVEDNGLEFHSIGGDPAKLMAYMVKNPGILPSRQSIRAGDIHQRRLEIAEMLEGSWKACTHAGDGVNKIDLSAHAQDEDVLMSLPPPFIADAIIANPPSYAHIHIAEKLAVPLHIMFTMPWSPTGAFPHPLANLDANKVDSRLANILSYRRMDFLTWEGLADLINRFREKTLLRDPITPIWGHDMLPRLRVPFTYCWPEVLIPKPADWGDHISISGYWFLSLGSKFRPDAALQEFLDAGPPPIYIGFGSIVVDDPDAFTQMIFDAVAKTGVRALVSKGWGNVGGANPPPNVYLLGNVPHDWLFPRVSAVVHHGGAGTTAIGIALGKPTVIVPFFGDQPWWAAMIYRAGAGPEAVPFKKLTADLLAENIRKALEPSMQARAKELAVKIEGEDGTKKAAEFFHSTPQMQNLQCFLYPERVAVWRYRKTNIQVSALAAATLVVNGIAKPDQFKLVRHKNWFTTEGAQDPVSGLVGTITTTFTGLVTDLRDFKKDISPPAHTPTDTSPPGKTLTPRTTDPSTRRITKALANLGVSLVGHSLKAPIALFYNVANGFHNAPAVFLSDSTVRVHPQITGLTSGIVRSGQELTQGLYDAVTGLVLQPYTGYKQSSSKGESRATGLAKGLGKGIGGLVLKTGAAVSGLPGYSLKGLERRVERWWRGSDAFQHGEDTVITRAKEHVRSLQSVGENARGDGSRSDSAGMWDESKGAGLEKRILESRVWEGYRQLNESRAMAGSDALEKEICERWDRLMAQL
ncbi:UDP-Glycosyltransferase/glycogen phosphorylase [Tothia fuscella]|uniref:UDP-Glycosyltransferase/glycogen phosphorylase n=1 Tax=Tothia fuscella TaxID=1048955 RepID=A0A9P4NNB1_9PEZI|nr:UDP-Glycosyltransferase/glycogen phosphorylase [Tothia fuscella]